MYIPTNTYQTILECLPILCVDLLIVHEGKCLLLLRDNEPAKGQYWFPGGRINKNELITETALRKAKEEVNLNCKFEKIVSIEETIFPQKEGMHTDVHTVNVCCYLTTDTITDLRFDHLHSDYAWVDKVDENLHPGVSNPLKLLGFYELANLMSGNVKISIILPNYNSEKYIARAIDSFLMQEYDNKEMIIVDGKSKDGSHAIIKAYVEKYNNIIWIQEKDRNVTDAINIGLKHCTGDFMAFLASDVYYYTNDIFSTINANYQKVPFDGVYFDYYSYNPNSRLVTLWKSPTIQFNKNNLLTYGTIAGFDNVFLSREVYTNHRYNPDFNLCSDWEFFLRITQHFTLFMYIEKIATVNVQDGYNLSLKYATEQMNQIKEVFRIYNSDNLVPYFGVKQKGVRGLVRRVAKKILDKL